MSGGVVLGMRRRLWLIAPVGSKAEDNEMAATPVGSCGL